MRSFSVSCDCSFEEDHQMMILGILFLCVGVGGWVGKGEGVRVGGERESVVKTYRF